jgi:hypothetical protein
MCSLLFIGNIASGGTDVVEFDDEDMLQSLIEESIRAESKPAATASTGGADKKEKKPTVPSKFGTIDGLHKDDDSSEEEGSLLLSIIE